MADRITRQSIENYRRGKWRLSRRLWLRSEQDAQDFIEDVGLCLLFACHDIDLPKLYDCAHPAANWWNWKDTLQARGKIFSGRVARKKATLMSMNLLPYFLRIYFSDGGNEDYEEEYYQGMLSKEARDVAAFLESNGPTPTDVLRKNVASPSKKGTRRFHKALLELQTHFKIATVNLVDRSWGIRVLDLFSNWVPSRIMKRTVRATSEEAIRTIVLAFLNTAGLATEGQIAHLFGWQEHDVEQVTGQLVREGRISRKEIYRRRGTYLACPEMLP